jgi:hypothetical protein
MSASSQSVAPAAPRRARDHFPSFPAPSLRSAPIRIRCTRAIAVPPTPASIYAAVRGSPHPITAPCGRSAMGCCPPREVVLPHRRIGAQELKDVLHRRTLWTPHPCDEAARQRHGLHAGLACYQFPDIHKCSPSGSSMRRADSRSAGRGAPLRPLLIRHRRRLACDAAHSAGSATTIWPVCSQERSHFWKRLLRHSRVGSVRCEPRKDATRLAILVRNYRISEPSERPLLLPP